MQGDSEMAHVVINNCYLICKKKNMELASDSFNVTIAMSKSFSTDQEKITRLITISRLYKHIMLPSRISSKYS